jgi:hypothetical protein
MKRTSRKRRTPAGTTGLNGHPARAPKLPWTPPPGFVPNLDDIVIQDDTPVDGYISEKNMRLLTEPLHSNWKGPKDGSRWIAMANVGVFHTYGLLPIVPDAALAVGVTIGSDFRKKENQSYFVWLRGKVPDVALEIVSNNEGGEDTTKLDIYKRIGVPYYVIFDPELILSDELLRVWKLQRKKYVRMSDPYYFPAVELGVRLWTGQYEDAHETWLRWCDRKGKLIPTGNESAVAKKREASQARAESERLRKKLRELGFDEP